MVENAHPDSPTVATPAPTQKAPPQKAAPRKASPRKSAGPQPPAGTRSATPRHVSGRAAARKVDEAGHIRLELPLLGGVRLPEPQRLAYYGAIGALGVLGVLEWPVALVLAVGHALTSDQHDRAVQQFGEALEDA